MSAGAGAAAVNERRVRWTVTLLVFAASAYFVPGASWSPVSRYCLTRAIVERGSFEITPDAESTGDRAQVNERFYTDKAPLPSLLAVPAYTAFHAAARATGAPLPAFRAQGTRDRPARVVYPNAAFQRGLYVCKLSTAAVAAAALAWTLFGVLRRRASARVSALAAAATVLATPLFAYGTSFFDHTVAAAALFGAFACADAAAPRRRLALAGALLGLAVGTEYLTAVLASAVAVYALAVVPRVDRPAAIGRLAAGAALPLAIVGLYHAACFGSPFRTGYSFISHPAFAAGQSSGFFGLTWPRPEALVGLLASPARGLFYVAPLALLAVYELLRGARRERDPALYLALAILAIAYVVNASYFQWNGGRALGPRHMVPALGFLGFGVALAFERRPSLAAALAGVSAFAVIGATAVGLEVPYKTDVLFGYLAPALREGRIARAPGASNLGLLLGLGARGSLAALGAVALAFAFAASRFLAGCPDEGPERGEPQ